MRFGFCAAALVVACFPFGVSADDPLTGLEQSKIDAVLAELNCRVTSETIERQDDGFVLRDVFCADGQFEIRLDPEFEVVGKAPE